MYTFEDIQKQKAGILKCREEHIETCSDCDDNFRCTLQMKHIEFEEAQQQEIDRLTYENRQLKAAMSEIFNSEPVDCHNPADTERINKLEQDYKDACKGRMIFFEEGISKNERIQALVADKDQQAGTIMRYEAMLKEAQQHLTKYRKVYGSIGAEAISEKISALLGGAEDGSSKDE